MARLVTLAGFEWTPRSTFDVAMQTLDSAGAPNASISSGELLQKAVDGSFQGYIGNRLGYDLAGNIRDAGNAVAEVVGEIGEYLAGVVFRVARRAVAGKAKDEVARRGKDALNAAVTVPLTLEMTPVVASYIAPYFSFEPAATLAVAGSITGPAILVTMESLLSGINADELSDNVLMIAQKAAPVVARTSSVVPSYQSTTSKSRLSELEKKSSLGSLTLTEIKELATLRAKERNMSNLEPIAGAVAGGRPVEQKKSAAVPIFGLGLALKLLGAF